MARTRKKAADPVKIDGDNGTVAVLIPPTVIVNAEPDANPPSEPEAPKSQPARRPRTRKAPAKAAQAPPVPMPAAPAPAPAVTVPPALVLDDLAHEAETLRHQLGDAGRQAEETRLLLQAMRHQHEELRREVEALHKHTGKLHEESAKQAEQWHAQLQDLTKQREEAGRGLAGLREQADSVKAELRESLKGAHEARSLFQETAKQSGQAEARFRKTAEQLIEKLRGQLEPLIHSLSQSGPHLEAFPAHGLRLEEATARLGEAEARFQKSADQLVEQVRDQSDAQRDALQNAVPHLESFPEQARQVLKRLDHAAQTLPDALRQLQRLEQQNQEAERRLSDLREQTAQEESRLELLQREGRELDGRLHESRQHLLEIDEKTKQANPEPAAEEKPEAPRPRLGMTVAPGIVVDDVEAGSAAQSAGLMAGDVIQSVNGTHVSDGEEVRALLRDAKGGEAVILTVSRAGQDVDLTVNLIDPAAEGQEESGRPWLGLTVHPGLVVEEVLPGSPAEAAGLARGDVIQSANGSPVNAGEQIRQVVLWEQLRQAVQAQEVTGEALPAEEPEGLRLEVSRCGQVREVKVPLAQAPLSA